MDPLGVDSHPLDPHVPSWVGEGRVPRGLLTFREDLSPTGPGHPGTVSETCDVEGLSGPVTGREERVGRVPEAPETCVGMLDPSSLRWDYTSASFPPEGVQSMFWVRWDFSLLCVGRGSSQEGGG